MSDEVVKIEKLSKGFKGKPVLDKISFSLKKGENVVLLGRSGSGKSVLLKIIAGLIPTDRGKVIVLGKEITKMKQKEIIPLRGKIGFLFQDSALYDSMTVEENVTFPLNRQVNKESKEVIREKAIQALRQVSMENSLSKYPKELSGGMKKRVALARALILEPEIMLYDEPTTGLDPSTGREINNLIIKMRDELGLSSIIVTHDLVCAEITGNRIMMLHEGRIGFEGSYEELENSESDFVSSFFR